MAAHAPGLCLREARGALEQRVDVHDVILIRGVSQPEEVTELASSWSARTRWRSTESPAPRATSIDKDLPGVRLLEEAEP